MKEGSRAYLSLVAVVSNRTRTNPSRKIHQCNQAWSDSAIRVISRQHHHFSASTEWHVKTWTIGLSKCLVPTRANVGPPLWWPASRCMVIQPSDEYAGSLIRRPLRPTLFYSWHDHNTFSSFIVCDYLVLSNLKDHSEREGIWDTVRRQELDFSLSPRNGQPINEQKSSLSDKDSSEGLLSRHGLLDAY